MTDPAPSYLRLLAELIALVVLVYYGLNVADAAAERPFACLGDVDGASAIRITNTARETVTPDELAALWALEGESLWVGYERGGWSERAAIRGETVFYDGLKDGARWWALVKVGAAYSVVYVFANTERYADVNGDHYGHHPCGGWEIAR
ncbi:MAG: hypothetical protein IPM16_06690 [Chloroflexi bacterium]|nr:hypothetical protein [Chloroflexota bacterium]